MKSKVLTIRVERELLNVWRDYAGDNDLAGMIRECIDINIYNVKPRDKRCEFARSRMRKTGNTIIYNVRLPHEMYLLLIDQAKKLNKTAAKCAIECVNITVKPFKIDPITTEWLQETGYFGTKSVGNDKLSQFWQGARKGIRARDLVQ